MSTNPVYAYGELADGTTWENLRVTLATKIAWERSARANKWDADTQPFTAGAYFSWHTARQKGLHNLTWDAFLTQAIDAGITQTTSHVDQDDQENPDRPTRAGIEQQ